MRAIREGLFFPNDSLEFEIVCFEPTLEFARALDRVVIGDGNPVQADFFCHASERFEGHQPILGEDSVAVQFEIEGVAGHQAAVRCLTEMNRSWKLQNLE